MAHARCTSSSWMVDESAVVQSEQFRSIYRLDMYNLIRYTCEAGHPCIFRRESSLRTELEG